ncbi:ketopantoate reductase family protein [Streptococcus oricebi]|uniref:Ketopantoate reductase N-terminal domain-containing protein n=1 Tax=Streptococcus oricebi TaxID=1547447 RepID=A0ABS5B2Q0_9STRE|nr:2-dehydropantoate 2-reductase N-terminal domain-containing protein [Streptococcus oricebi]MBP2623108.1 hypothetical protein [Streptococcus oricebi]
MKVLIYGAGTIGLTYAWLLSRKNEVDVLVREQKLKKYQAGFRLFLKDLRKRAGIPRISFSATTSEQS